MVHDNSLKNLKIFEKGNTASVGNGRPPNSYSIVSELKKLANREIELVDPFTKKSSKGEIRRFLALRLASEALKGNITAMKECLDRLDGKVDININGNLNANMKQLDFSAIPDDNLKQFVEDNKEHDDN